MNNAAPHFLCSDEISDHYLKSELYSLLQRRDDIRVFLSNTILDGVSYWDLESPNDKWMSSTFWHTLGYEPETMPHKAAAWQSIIHPDDLKTATKQFRKHCADPGHSYDQVTRYKHAEGHTVWIRCRGLAIRDKRGQPVRMLGAHSDITEQKTNVHEIDDKPSQIDKREVHAQALNEAASIVGNDLKAPLRQMAVFVNLLENEFAGTEEHNPAASKAIEGMNAALDCTHRTVASLHELLKACQT